MRNLMLVSPFIIHHKLVSAASSKCYRTDGREWRPADPNFPIIPCYPNDDVTHCCGPQDICLDNGLCLSKSSFSAQNLGLLHVELATHGWFLRTVEFQSKNPHQTNFRELFRVVTEYCLDFGGSRAYTQQGCTDPNWRAPCNRYFRGQEEKGLVDDGTYAPLKFPT